VIDRLGIGTMFLEAEDAFEAAYDIAMGYPGTPPTLQVMVYFQAIRPFTIGLPNTTPEPEAQSLASCQAAPTGGAVVLTVARNGTGIGTVTFANGSNTGVVAIPSPVTFAAGDELTVTTPAQIFAIANIAITFAGSR
jgi:hypothetical protein